MDEQSRWRLSSLRRQSVGARVEDIDGHTLIDFCLGDTGAMAGHSPKPMVDAVVEQIAGRGGVTTMMPTADADWVNDVDRHHAVFSQAVGELATASIGELGG